MSKRFVIICQFVAYDDADNPCPVGNGSPVETVRAGEASNLNRTETNADTAIYDAVVLGAVPAGAMEFAISNLSTTDGDTIEVFWDESGTKRPIGYVYAGDTRIFSLAHAPYVKGVAASIPYLSGVAVR